MTGVLAWKEYREQRAVWLLMAVVGAALLGVLTAWFGTQGASASNHQGMLLAGALLLAWSYGMVCGALLLANETEDGTLAFLDTLPGSRRQVWRAKCLAGLGLLMAQALFLTGALAALGVTDTGAATGWAFAAACVLGVVGMGWGLFAAARAQTVLQALGKAVGWQALVTGVAGLLLALAIIAAGEPTSAGWWLWLPLSGIAAGLAGLVALVRSARAFAQADRLRRAGIAAGGLTMLTPTSWLALMWLEVRRSRRFVLVLGAIAIAAGVAMLFEPLVGWPLATLLVGALCGARAFAGAEQATAPMVAQHCLPPGRWAATVLSHFALAGIAYLLVLVPRLLIEVPMLLGLTTRGDPLPELLARLFGPLFIPTRLTRPETFLFTWLIYGFSAGVLCGLLFRRPFFAYVAAPLVGIAAVAIWLPSFVGGGLWWWQVMGMPLGMLVASRLLVRGWADGHGKGRLMALGVGLTLALLSTAAGLWYRVVEVPHHPNDPTMETFQAALPDPATDEPVKAIRAALEEMERREDFLAERPTRPLFPDQPSTGSETLFRFQLHTIVDRGWPPDGTELAGWVERVFDAAWPAALARAADGPLPVLINPRTQPTPFFDPVLGRAQSAAILLAIHGLAGQARGDDAVVPKDLHTALFLVRALKNRGTTTAWVSGVHLERQLLRAVDHWLRRSRGAPGPLRDVLGELVRHDAECPADVTEAWRADWVEAQNILRHPELFVAINFPSDSRNPPRLRNELIGRAWQVPWEQARQQRLLHVLVEVGLGRRSLTEQYQPPWIEFPGLPLSAQGVRAQRDDRFSLTQRRARFLTVALRLYAAEKGKPAPTLQALVPDYLNAVPTDPFDGKPFRYRLSRGETVVLTASWWMNKPEHRQEVPAGAGIIWSVGPDGHDDGGTFEVDANHNNIGDLIFLAPTAARSP